MRRFLLLVVFLLASPILFAQGLCGKWLAYEGSDGAELVVVLKANGAGTAELALERRFEAVSYGEGSQFWGTFRTTGGYYFLVKGVMSEGISFAQADSTLTIVRRSAPVTKVSAWLDEAYSTRELSAEGDYKRQVLAQWKRDFPQNEDVEKAKWMMEHYFSDFYGDAFNVLLEGRYIVKEHTDSTIVLQGSTPTQIPLFWRKMRETSRAPCSSGTI